MPINEGHPYTDGDCNDTVYTAPLSGKVIVANCAILPNDHPGQLFYCSREGVTNEFIIDKTVFAISLSTGEHHRFGRSDIIGTLKPELLHDEAKLHLSQIRPDGAPESENPEYCGYCFLGNGLYSSGVWLRDPEEAVVFAEMQAPYQHRVMICDRDDISVAELETALSIVTTAYLRSEDIQTAIEENLGYLNPPVYSVFSDFNGRIRLVDPDIPAALREMKVKIENDVFREWCDALSACQHDRSLKTILTPIVA